MNDGLVRDVDGDGDENVDNGDGDVENSEDGDENNVSVD